MLAESRSVDRKALLDLMSDTGGRAMPNTDADAGTSHRPPRILVVEDDPLVRWSITEALRDLGVTVIEATTADEAWDYLSTGAEVDLVFTDFQMPGSMNGGQLAARVNAKHPNLQVIITSGYTGGYAHAAPILMKPYELLATAATLADLAVKNRPTDNDGNERKACSSPG